MPPLPECILSPLSLDYSFVVLLLASVPLQAGKSLLVYRADLHMLDEVSLMTVTRTIFTSSTIVGGFVCFRFFLTGCLALLLHTHSIPKQYSDRR